MYQSIEKPFRQNSSLLLLSLAAISLCLSGIFFLEQPSLKDTFLKVCTVLFVTVFIYSFNDILDNKAIFSKYLGHLRLGGMLLLSICSIYFLAINNFAIIWPLVFILFLGITYSLDINIKNVNYKVKNIFIVKNVFIALGWAALIYFGVGSFFHYEVTMFSLFVGLQVFIGSIIRDLADVIDDSKENVLTFPVKYGNNTTITFLHSLNIISALFLFLIIKIIPDQQSFYTGLFFICAWRMFNLYGLKNNYKSSLFLQYINLMTCFIIFLIRILI